MTKHAEETAQPETLARFEVTDQELGPMSEAYRDRAPDIAGRLDLVERALAQIIETLERIERRLPDGSAAGEPQP